MASMSERAIAWSRDGRRLAVALGAEISIFDRAFREKLRLRGHEGAVTSVAFAPVRLTLARTDAVGEGEGEGEGEVAEGEGEGEGETNCGCCCQASGDPRGMRRTMGLFGFFVGVVGLVTRGWRSFKRKRMYQAKKPETPNDGPAR